MNQPVRELSPNQIPTKMKNGFYIWEQVGPREQYDVHINFKTNVIKAFEVEYDPATDGFKYKLIRFEYVADLLPMLYRETLTGLKRVNLNATALRFLKTGKLKIV